MNNKIKIIVIVSVLFILLHGSSFAASLIGEEVYFHRISDNTVQPFFRLFEEGTLMVGAGSEFNDGTHDINIGASSIRITELNPGGGGFASWTPHEYRFFIPHRITGFSLINNGFGTLSASDISFSEHVLIVNISGLSTLENGYAEIELQNASAVIPLPTGTDIFTYPPTAVPLNSINPSLARPIGVGSVATGGNTLSLQVGLNQLEGAGDVYLAIYAPSLNPEIHVINPDLTLQPVSMGLVPWRANTTGPINEDLYGTISGLPAATYYLYAVVTNAGSLTTRYLWKTSFIIP